MHARYDVSQSIAASVRPSVAIVLIVHGNMSVSIYMVEVYKYKYGTYSLAAKIRHYDAQASPIRQYIVIYFFLSYLLYAYLVDRISILSLIVGQ